MTSSTSGDLVCFQSLVMLSLAASRMCVILLLWVFGRDSMVKFSRASSGEGNMFNSVTCERSEKTSCQYCVSCGHSYKMCNNVPSPHSFSNVWERCVCQILLFCMG